MESLSSSLLESLRPYNPAKDAQFAAAFDKLASALPSAIRPEQRELLLEWLLQGLADGGWSEKGPSKVNRRAR